MKRVLFVCLGNICRSPVAEGIFMHKVRERGLESRLTGDSAGTAGYHIGEPPHTTSSSVAREYGVALNHRARQFQQADFERFDHILCMDRSNYETVRRLAGTTHLQSKVGMIGQFLSGPVPAPVEGAPEIPDPYYGPVAGFHDVHQLLDTATSNLITHLTSAS
ncbi:MAG: low molecular weight phosphotyrosine protein phosphatase [Bacteroidetes bacterium]|nr:low molecular weight phosphotyrosine protein phosphatase [Bacteroidota bacterium]